MKKYVICLLMCLLMALTFVGCSKPTDNTPLEDESTVEDESVSEEKEDTSTDSSAAEGEINLEELFQQGMDSYAEKDMEPPVLFPETDIEYLESFYPGISYANIKQLYIAMAPVTNAPMEIALVEVADGSDVAAIRDIFQERIDARANDTTYPEESAVWKKNGIVTIRGNYIFMAVMTDDYGIPEEFILD